MKFPFASLFKKPLESVSDEITSKFKTPFFTTYIIVWVIKNNLFIYHLFFNSRIKDKSSLLKVKFDFCDTTFYLDLFITLILSLGVLILFYLFLNISRSITVFSEERLKLNILNKLKSKTISTIDDTSYWKDKSNKLNKTNIELESEINLSRLNEKESKRKLNDLENEYSKVKNLAEKYLKMRINDFEKLILENNQIKDNMLKTHINEFKKSLEGDYSAYKSEIEPKGFIVG